jgi:hypothetical protein
MEKNFISLKIQLVEEQALSYLSDECNIQLAYT